MRFIGVLLLGLWWISSAAFGVAINSDLKRYKIYQGDLNGDNKPDYYFEGLSSIMLLHGDIITPITLPPLPNVVVYSHGNGFLQPLEESYTAAQRLAKNLVISTASQTTLGAIVTSSSMGNGSINLVNSNTNLMQTLGQIAAVDPATDVMTEAVYKGALTGLQSVGPDGSFNYSLPLAIPVGINGVQPKLQLNYNSNTKNGLLGWGWTLGGLSVISRCNATIIRDGYVSGIQAGDNYKYCIDGQRLVEIAAGEYRTESESFLRVKKMADYWEVTSNSGMQSRYGFNTDSKLEDDQNQTYAWYLDQQKDISNNSWTVVYNKSSSNGIQSHYPDSIAYTSNLLFNALHAVKFHYEDRGDISVKYIAGVRIKNDKRLSRVELKSSATTVHSYVLTYQQAGQTYHGKIYSDPAKTSRLASVNQCIGSS